MSPVRLPKQEAMENWYRQKINAKHAVFEPLTNESVIKIARYETASVSFSVAAALHLK